MNELRELYYDRPGGTRCIPGDNTARSVAAGVVGDTFTFRFGVSLGTPSITVSRAPAGSSATPVDNTFAPDLAGRYVLAIQQGNVTNGAGTRTVTLAVFPAAALTAKTLQEPDRDPSGQSTGWQRSETAVRRLLTIGSSNTNERNTALLDSLDALTTQSPLPSSSVIDWLAASGGPPPAGGYQCNAHSEKGFY